MITLELLREVVDHARRAASAHNTQPWRTRLDGNRLLVEREHTRALEVGDPTGRETFLSLGVFLEHLTLASAAHGLRTDVDVTARPGSDEVASIRLAAADSDPTAERLTAAMARRRTVRGAYAPDLPPDFLPAVYQTAEDYEAILSVLTETERKREVAELVAEGTRIAFSLPPMLRELSQLVRWSTDAGAQDGMWLESMWDDAASNEAEPGRYFLDRLSPADDAARYLEWYAASPALFLIRTEFDGPEAWVMAGRLAGRLMLEAADRGMTQCISAAPIEVPTLAPRLRAVSDGWARPQMLIRFGFPLLAPRYPPSPRLPADALIAATD